MASAVSTPVYLDYHATTPVDPRVFEVMQPWLAGGVSGLFGNPSSMHGFGERARNAVEQARAQVAALVGVDPALGPGPVDPAVEVQPGAVPGGAEVATVPTEVLIAADVAAGAAARMIRSGTSPASRIARNTCAWRVCRCRTSAAIVASARPARSATPTARWYAAMIAASSGIGWRLRKGMVGASSSSRIRQPVSSGPRARPSPPQVATRSTWRRGGIPVG